MPPRGFLTENLSKIEGLELIINGRYKRCIDELRTRARAETKDSTEPFFRMLQILEHMKDWPDETPITKQREMASKPVLQMGIRVPLAGYYGR